MPGLLRLRPGHSAGLRSRWKIRTRGTCGSYTYCEASKITVGSRESRTTDRSPESLERHAPLNLAALRRSTSRSPLQQGQQ